ncbi:MAG: metallophosphoesterase [Sulfolobales archaeon]
MRLYEIERNLKIVPGYPFLYLDSEKALIFADLHLGYETAMAEEGVYLPRAQINNIIDDLRSVMSSLKVEKIFIVGDLKHRFDRLSRQEREETEILISFLRSQGVDRIVLVKGNHDNYISTVLKRLDVEVTDKLILDNILLIHGHLDPFEEELDLDRIRIVIYGHEHPSIVLRDRLGKIAKLPVFLETPIKIRSNLILKGLILPASGYYQMGSPVTLDSDKYLSPITRKYAEITDIKPYAVIKNEMILEMPTLSMLLEFIEV